MHNFTISFFSCVDFIVYDRFTFVDIRETARFFDSRAERWDEMPHDPVLVNRILDKALPSGTRKVLDVACGTGVLFPFFHERGITDITAVDVSQGMINVARRKSGDCGSLKLICADAATYPFEGRYDSIIIYNAFPHFPDPETLISNLVLRLEKGGLLSIAHSAGREELNAFHKEHASPISFPLPPAEEVASLLEKHLTVRHVISEEHLYQVVAEFL